MLGYSSYSSSLLYYKCMTNQKENRVVVIYNAVFVRSEADSNRCIRFCRPLPSHSAIRPFVLSCRPPLDSLFCKRLHRLSRVRSSLTLLPVPHALSTSNISHSLNLRSLALRLKSLALSRLQVPPLALPFIGPLGWVRNMVLGMFGLQIYKKIYICQNFGKSLTLFRKNITFTRP